MSLHALLQLQQQLEDQERARFNGKLPCRRQIVGYSKGHWLVEYCFRETYGYSYHTEWEQDERSIAHQKQYPND